MDNKYTMIKDALLDVKQTMGTKTKDAKKDGRLTNEYVYIAKNIKTGEIITGPKKTIENIVEKTWKKDPDLFGNKFEVRKATQSEFERYSKTFPNKVKDVDYFAKGMEIIKQMQNILPRYHTVSTNQQKYLKDNPDDRYNSPHSKEWYDLGKEYARLRKKAFGLRGKQEQENKLKYQIELSKVDIGAPGKRIDWKGW